MSSAFYNGCLLEYVKLVHSKKTTRYAGPNYLYTEYQITVEGLYNPAMNSYAVDAQGRPVFTPGNLAPQTEAALAYALSQPRKPFAFVAANTLVTFSPKTVTVRTPVATTPSVGVAIGLLGTVGAASAGTRLVVRQRYGLTDCANGPFTAPPEVYENIGDKTFRVRFTVTTFLNDTPPAAALKSTPLGAKATGVQYPTSPLLANEYTVAQRIDQDFFTTRHISGRAVFRSDVMQALQLYPDRLRYWLGHPIPNRMRREEINVEAQSDGVTLLYDFTDRERILFYDPNIFTRVEMVYSEDVEKLGLESMLRTGLAAGLSAFRGINRLARGQSPFARGGLSQLGVLFGAGTALVAGTFAGVPVATHHVVGRFWGHAKQNRRWMHGHAQTTFNELMVLNAGFSNPGSTNITLPTINIPGIGQIGGGELQAGDVREAIREDWSGMYVEVNKTWVSSRIQTLLDGVLPVPELPVVEPLDDVVTEPDGQVLAILHDPMRGTYLGAAVASALRDSTDLWAQAQDPLYVRDREVVRPLVNGRVAGITLP